MGAGFHPMRVVLAEDWALLRAGLERVLVDAGFEVVGACDDVAGLLACVESMSPDAAIVDVRLPPSFTDEGLRAAEDIRRRWPSVGVVLLSQYVEVGLASQLLAGGAERLGYLLKDRVTDVDEFASAVRRVAAGGSAFDPTVVSQLLARRQGAEELNRLTPREREVLALMAEGRSNQAIGDQLVVSLRAVEKYVTAIFQKLGLPATSDCHRRVLAVLMFLNPDGKGVNRTTGLR
jgi:DNA-binding NarL/FixJ family response regulator